MRRTSFAALLLLLSGCAALQPPPHGSAFDDRLYARIVDVGGSVRVETSRAAYVALFEVLPGRGVGLLYPAYGGEGNYTHGGVASLRISRARTYHRHFRGVDFGASAGGQRFVYLIASERPLRLNRMMASSDLRDELGFSAFTSRSAYAMMERINEMVLPAVYDDEWATDLYALPAYGTGYDDGYAVQWARIRCPDGSVVEGHRHLLRDACASRRAVEPRVRTPVAPPPRPASPADSVREPSRRRPEPRTQPEGERITAGADRPRVHVMPPTRDRVRPQRGEPAGGADAPGPRERSANRDVPRVAAPAAAPPETAEPPRMERVREPSEESRPEPRIERAEPREESRPEPRIERAEPRIERAPEPRVERPEPRAESPPEPRAERAEPRAERPEPRVEAAQ